MDLTFSTPLKGNLVLCSDYRAAALHRSPGLYKFVWVRRGCLRLEVDHIPMELRAGMLLPLTPLHTLDVTRAEGEYLILAFDSNFYCIFGHDGEVSCSGLLSTAVPKCCGSNSPKCARPPCNGWSTTCGPNTG